MESTGKCWIPIYNVLEKIATLFLLIPKYVKAIRGKTDKMPNGLLTSSKHDLVAGSFTPADIRQLRDLMRYRFKKLRSIFSFVVRPFACAITVTGIP